jgi:(S)-ureidoglycine aminohydrolase
MHELGATRSVVTRNYAVLTPDTFVRKALPGMTGATAIVHASPAIGAGFTQYTVEFEDGGVMGPAEGQRFLYVLDGEVAVDAGTERTVLRSGGYAYLPNGSETVSATGKGRAAVIEKPYRALAGAAHPVALTGSEESVAGSPLNGDDWLTVRPLLPDCPEFDFAVNTMEYRPGASLPMVEIHVMEHGLLMLEGAGIYRLDDDWLPVKAGDFIWMGPYCPQWFCAVGKAPAKYLIYKDWNRHPLVTG